jgi:hypothetical protein
VSIVVGWRLRCLPLVLVALLPLVACESRQEEPESAPPVAAATILWHAALGTWSGSGDRQTESFDVTTGSMRLTWEAIEDGAPGANRFRVALHSSISGRLLQTIVDTHGAGAGTVDLGASPRVAYLLIESDQIRWSVTLQEAVPGNPVAGSARD